MYLTTDQADRDSATGFRMICEILGVLLAAGIQGAMLTIYGTKITCENSTTPPTDPGIITSTTLPLAITEFPAYNKLVIKIYYLKLIY